MGGVVSRPICINKLRNDSASANQGHSTFAKAATMCTACLEYAYQHSHIPPFLLMQNLSSKRIAPTDNMRPESDDTKRHHWWFKG